MIVSNQTPFVLDLVPGYSYSIVDYGLLTDGDNDFKLRIAGIDFDYDLKIVFAQELTHIFYNDVRYNRNSDGDFIIRINNLNSLNRVLLTYPFEALLLNSEVRIGYSDIRSSGNIIGFNVYVYCHGLTAHTFRVLLHNNDVSAEVYIMGEQIEKEADYFVLEYVYYKQLAEIDKDINIRVETNALSVLNSSYNFTLTKNSYSLILNIEHLFLLNGNVTISVPFVVTAISGISKAYVIQIHVEIIDIMIGDEIFTIVIGGDEYNYYGIDIWPDEIYSRNHVITIGSKQTEVTLSIVSDEFKFYLDNGSTTDTITTEILYDVRTGRYYILLELFDGEDWFILRIDVLKELHNGKEVLLLAEINSEDFYFVYDEDNYIEGELIYATDVLTILIADIATLDIRFFGEYVDYGSWIFYYIENDFLIITINGVATYAVILDIIN
jgi:hypothetical protein